MKKLDSFSYMGKLIQGEVIPDSPKYAKGMLQFFEDCPVKVIVERRKRDRSKQQNNYYWGVVLPEISIHTGHSAEELHRIFKSQFLKEKRLWRGGNITVLRSTSELSTNEFAEYLQSVILEANELSIEIPPPDAEGQVIKSLSPLGDRR